MKVICSKILDPDTGEEKQKDSWLTTGHTYTVLSVIVGASGKLQFRLIGDDKYTPFLADANQFEVTDTKIPKSWEINFSPNSHFSISPKAWCRVGFWDDYFDGDPEAEAIFDREKEVIFSEESGADK